MKNRIAFKIWAAVPHVEKYKTVAAVQILETICFILFHNDSSTRGQSKMRRFIYESSATNIRDWSLAYSFIFAIFRRVSSSRSCCAVLWSVSALMSFTLLASLVVGVWVLCTVLAHVQPMEAVHEEIWESAAAAAAVQEHKGGTPVLDKLPWEKTFLRKFPKERSREWWGEKQFEALSLGYLPWN